MKMTSMFRSILIFNLSLLVSSRTAKVNKHVIGFPEYEENPLLVNKQDRKPVFLPSTCPENELYYPGDQTDDWICDCRPGYIFHPDTEKCWLAYRRGPCPNEEYLVLPTDSMVPVCVPNPCKNDSKVPWNGQCEQLGTRVCGDDFPIKELWINATTVTVDCVLVYINNRFSLDAEFETSTTCPLGGRQNVLNKSPSNQTNPRKIDSTDSSVRTFTSHLKSFLVGLFNLKL